MHLFEMEEARLPRGWRAPAQEAHIHYWMNDGSPSVTISVTDAQGELVRELTGTGQEGFNAVSWDLTLTEDTPGSFAPPSRVPAGNYTVIIRGNGATAEGTLTVVN
jgi:hypothetical protein